MGPEVLPTFRLQTIGESGLIGRFEPSPWAEERAVAGLYLGGGRFLWGRFCRVDQSEATCEFEPDDLTELLALRIGESYPYVDGYYGERAELVLDSTRIWHLSVFRPTDSVRFEGTAGIMETRASGHTPDGGVTVPGGWDHEHCFICQEKIGTGGQTHRRLEGPRGRIPGCPQAAIRGKPCHQTGRFRGERLLDSVLPRLGQ
jgi:hypothetical protein